VSTPRNVVVYFYNNVAVSSINFHLTTQTCSTLKEIENLWYFHQSTEYSYIICDG